MRYRCDGKVKKWGIVVAIINVTETGRKEWCGVVVGCGINNNKYNY